jgi:hypothetical protein
MVSACPGPPNGKPAGVRDGMEALARAITERQSMMNVRYSHLADISSEAQNVRFRGQSGHRRIGSARLAQEAEGIGVSHNNYREF